MTELPETIHSLVEAVRSQLRKRQGLPLFTYRLEFHSEHFTFRDAGTIADYLADLGISHVHASPYLHIDSEASHGYAVVDHSRLNPHLGSQEDYDGFVKALCERGMGQILDIVPNHMAAAPGENHWWTDVLENGQSSPFANHFDIEWEPVQEQLENRILLPALGQQFGQALEAGELRLGHEDGAFFLNVYNRRLPIDPKSYDLILKPSLAHLQTQPPKEECLRELESILSAIEHLPERTVIEEERRQERQREKEIIKSRLGRLSNDCPELNEALEKTLAELNGHPGDPASFDELESLLKRQVYRLSHWKAASDEVNYRRFFDVNELAAICTERIEVFEDSHRFVMELLVEGKIQGLRIDHVDGLFDPRQYLWRLQWEFLRRLGRQVWQQQSVSQNSDGSPAWEDLEGAFLDAIHGDIGGLAPGEVLCSKQEPNPPQNRMPKAKGIGARQPPYVVVEKILGPEEPLPEDWPVAGTSGYDFLNQVGGLFVEPEGFAKIRRAYGRFSGEEPSFERVVAESKRLILESSMASELSLLGHQLKRIAEKHRHSRDFTLNTLLRALRDAVACFGVYRTYAGPEGVSKRDEEVIRRAIRCARRRNPLMEPEVFDFLQKILLGEYRDDPAESGRPYEFFVGRFQQVTSPVMAKGVEDTAFYRYLPLISVNEVGGHPSQATVSVEQFHAENVTRQKQHPFAILTTSTHDTKRSEDVRARINVLSEIPGPWRSAITRWARMNRHFQSEVNGEAAPSRNDEYLLYQTLVGSWPIEPCSQEEHEEYVQRIERYLEKATHEAKLRTSWIAPNAEYDEAVQRFVRGVLRDQPGNQFLDDFKSFHAEVLPAGLFTAVSQTLLKLTSPGVPELYQGQELWDFSLVDPDNRRPVDYGVRRTLLDEIKAAAEDNPDSQGSLCSVARSLVESPTDPRLKLFITWRALQFRKLHAELFQSGTYLPLEIKGELAGNVCAFAWSKPEERKSAIIIAPRLLKSLLSFAKERGKQTLCDGGLWNETYLLCPDVKESRYENAFTGQACQVQKGRLSLADALADFPFAVLASEALNG